VYFMLPKRQSRKTRLGVLSLFLSHSKPHLLNPFSPNENLQKTKQARIAERKQPRAKKKRMSTMQKKCSTDRDRQQSRHADLAKEAERSPAER
jgi:hypothetical protein